VSHFLRWALRQAGVRHRNVVRVLDLVGYSEGLAYAGCEYMEGRDLRARLARGPLPPQEAVSLVLALAQAVGELHLQGLIPDLRPTKVLFAADGTPKFG